jgi:general secretion pathway protein J
MKERGFTLVEMLVALSIFAVIASIGVGLLRASIGTQDAVQDRLSVMGAVNRLRAVMASDLSQAALRPVRGENGVSGAAFRGDAQGFALVHRGAAMLGDGSGPAVQRAEYRFQNSEWRRASAARVDGTPLGDGDALAREVQGIKIRYRDQRGEWRGEWNSDQQAGLPAAVELTLTRNPRPPLVMLFAVGPALAPPEPVKAAP